MHTIGQHKCLSLVREEGDPTKLGAGSDFGGAGSGSGLFRHKLSAAYYYLHSKSLINLDWLENTKINMKLLC